MANGERIGILRVNCIDFIFHIGVDLESELKLLLAGIRDTMLFQVVDELFSKRVIIET
jgi:hypothetical protein